jgi:hypothetical protein
VARAFALALSLTAAFAAAAHAAVSAKHVMRETIVGDIRALDPQRIAIGRLTCAVPAKLSPTVGRFVVGDPVRISCLNGTLTAATYAPDVAPNQSTKAGGGNAPTTFSPPKPSCGLPCVTSISYSLGTATLGGQPPADLTTVSGAITDISDGRVTVSGLTCTFAPAFTTPFDQLVRVGDNVVLACTAGRLTSMRSVGVVPR